MKIKDQCVSLELAKKLKELGVKQESLFYYQNNPYNDGQDCIDLMINQKESVDGENVIMNSECENNLNPKYSAFTSAELGEILPVWSDSSKRDTNDWHVRVFDKNIAIKHHSFGETEAEARAKMLIHLLEKGLIKNE